MNIFRTLSHKWINSKRMLSHMSKVSFSHAANGASADELDLKITTEQQKKVVDLINSFSILDLVMFPGINKSLAERIDKRKPLTSIKDLLEVKGLGEKSILRLSAAVISEESEEHFGMYAISRKKVEPAYKNKVKPKSLIALHLAPPNLGWIHMDEDFKVLDWNWEEIKLDKFNLLVLQKQLWNLIVTKLPKPDLYVIEQLKLPPKEVLRQQPVIQADLLLKTLLNFWGSLQDIDCRHAEENDKNEEDIIVEIPAKSNLLLKQKVYTLKANVVNHVFGVSVGSERISIGHIADTLLSDNQTVYDVKVDVNAMLKYLYRECEVTEQETMASCLLQAVVFYKLLDHSEKLFRINKLKQWKKSNFK